MSEHKMKPRSVGLSEDSFVKFLDGLFSAPPKNTIRIFFWKHYGRIETKNGEFHSGSKRGYNDFVKTLRQAKREPKTTTTNGKRTGNTR